jgi:hypothetical protein
VLQRWWRVLQWSGAHGQGAASLVVKQVRFHVHFSYKSTVLVIVSPITIDYSACTQLQSRCGAAVVVRAVARSPRAGRRIHGRQAGSLLFYFSLN